MARHLKFTGSDLTDLFADFNGRKELWDCREEMVRSSIASVVHVTLTVGWVIPGAFHFACPDNIQRKVFFVPMAYYLITGNAEVSFHFTFAFWNIMHRHRAQFTETISSKVAPVVASTSGHSVRKPKWTVLTESTG